MTPRTPRALGAALVVTAIAGLSAQAATAQDLKGTFGFTPGKSKVVKKHGKRTVQVTGTYFRMVQSGKSGKKHSDFVLNNNSRSKDKTYTLLRPGIDGGLRTGSYQPMPDPPFDNSVDKSSLANRIMKPESFFGIQFSLSTDPTDQQSGTQVVAPTVRQKGKKLGGDLRAFTASWNGIFFNQGSPKPAGNRPGQTRSVSGTYNPKTRAYTLVWKSQIVGGPFGQFTGFWHLQGKFKPGS